MSLDAAFPRTTFVTPERDHVGHDGMTKRELIAMHVMAALCSRERALDAIELLPNLAVIAADALLDELAK